jgi:hypothetical protein
MDTIYNEQTMISTYIQPKNSLRRNQKELKLIKVLVSEFQKFENKMLLSKDIESLRYICNLLEDAVKKTDKINKKNVVISVYKQVFGDGNIDQDFIEKGIEFLWENGKIKKLSTLKKYIYPIGKFFLKRFV